MTRIKGHQVVAKKSWAWLISEQASQHVCGDDDDKINKINSGHELLSCEAITLQKPFGDWTPPVYIRTGELARPPSWIAGATLQQGRGKEQRAGKIVGWERRDVEEREWRVERKGRMEGRKRCPYPVLRAGGLTKACLRRLGQCPDKIIDSVIIYSLHLLITVKTAVRKSINQSISVTT